MMENGLQPDAKNVDAIDNFPSPKFKRNLRCFPEFINCIAKFVPNMLVISEPL